MCNIQKLFLWHMYTYSTISIINNYIFPTKFYPLLYKEEINIYKISQWLWINKTIVQNLLRIRTILVTWKLFTHACISFEPRRLLFGLELLRPSKSTQCSETESGVSKHPSREHLSGFPKEKLEFLSHHKFSYLKLAKTRNTILDMALQNNVVRFM